jgi:hypothetical protein
MDDDTIEVFLSDVYGQKIYDRITENRDVIFNNQDEFNTRIPGIAIKGGSNSDAIVAINSLFQTSFIELSYRGLSEVETRSTLIYLDNGNLLDPDDNPVGYFNLDYDESRSPFQELNQSDELIGPVNDLIYLQSIAGIFPKLEFDNYFDWLEEQQNIVVNSIRLKIRPLENVQEGFNNPLSIGFVSPDSTGNFNFANISFFGPFIRSNGTDILTIPFSDERKGYSASVFQHLEFVQDGTITATEFFIVPIVADNFNGNVNLIGDLNSIVVRPNNVTVEVIYTTFE